LNVGFGGEDGGVALTIENFAAEIDKAVNIF
jgi:hypothetical protein